MRTKKAGLMTKIVILALLIYMATSLLDLRTQLQTAQAQLDDLDRQVTAQIQENTKLADASQTATIPRCWNGPP